MKLSAEYADGVLTIRLYGELDHHTATASLTQVRRVLEKYLPRSCALDLSQLSFMDSSGIAFILKLQRLLKGTGGQLWLIHPAEQPGRILDASGLSRIVPINYQESESLR